MENKQILSLLECFSREYHYKHSFSRIFTDEIAEKLFSEDEKEGIGRVLAEHIKELNPRFRGDAERAVKNAVEGYIAPLELGRSVFCERALKNEIMLGCRQYLMIGAGYSTFSQRNTESKLKVIEVDDEEVLRDKEARLKCAGLERNAEYIACRIGKESLREKLLLSGFDTKKKIFCSMCGIAHWLKRDGFAEVIDELSGRLTVGCAAAFDYPDEYTYAGLEKLLSQNGFLIYEHMDAEQMQERFFRFYNVFEHRRMMRPPKDISYCLAVKHR